ncbi:hypothetical protein AG1IA_08137 [Rhizoctonia solani AG-1 IA]|uniref:Uncharacterized protein n=1 Tax=Thanatephorus cucumeris (strain AG1-IA) TaxID=983506 RepID=L8WNA7_THACA|nr:hypothetical protein AG1IA_08137 [Rhizoctonia solani AG-1 IA]
MGPNLGFGFQVLWRLAHECNQAEKKTGENVDYKAGNGASSPSDREPERPSKGMPSRRRVSELKMND